MKKYISLILLSLVHLLPICLFAQSNIVRVEYFIDNDPGFGLANNVSITAAPTISNFTFPINPASISTGIHTLILRAKDANGNWSLQNSLIFYKPYSISSSSLTNITKVEYFIDKDPGFGLATNVSITPSANLANLVIPFNPSTIDAGIHTIIVRARDANGNWSLHNAKTFYKPYSIGTATLANITKVEYFIDNDPGFGLATNVSITASADIANIIIPLNPSTLNTGIHSIIVRAKDANGNWSLHNTKVFYKPYAISSTPMSNITKVEYFIDNDPGVGLATNVSITASTNITNVIIPLNPTSLASGMHTLIIRARDGNGNWSLQNTKVFYKPYSPPTATTLSNISKIEYFLDFDPGYGQGINVPFTPSTNISNMVIPLNTFPMSVCEHKLFIRAKDVNGNWSLLNEKVINIPMTISLKLFLQGFYFNNGFMVKALENQGVQSGPCDEVDSVTVELHASASPFNTVFTYKGVLRTDGILPCKFPASVNGNSYYIAIKHRSTIETWSASPVLMSQTAFYDFSNLASKAYGNNMIALDPNRWAMYSGDVNQDNNIDLDDFALLELSINNFAFGYETSDISGDGNVDLGDVPLVELNINNFIFSSKPN